MEDSNLKILIVDDDPGIGSMLKLLLEFKNYEVIVCENPGLTEEIIEKNDIGLVILDMLISGVNGTDVCRRLKENESTKPIPVLMMSALHNADASCKAAGANDFISKPFEMENLLAKIQELLSKTGKSA